MSKRGLSDVVTTVLVILLVLAAIVLVWAFLQPALKKSAQSIETESLISSLIIVRGTVIDYTNAKVTTFMVKRESGPGEVVGFDVVLEGFDGTRKVFRDYETKAMKEFETAVVVIDYSGSINSLKKIILAPLITNPNTGQPITGKTLGNHELTDDERKKTDCNNIPYISGEWCCGADINRDNHVRADDLNIFRAQYNNDGCSAPTWCNNADINRDGTVSISDYIDLAAQYAKEQDQGQNPPPHCFGNYIT
ncbi:hypothetical protein KW805_00455 [Candidatus Pacearchaeota archaeon]|nr:hypothetical protein [Candidatus Pacearchaeota archaeon]